MRVDRRSYRLRLSGGRRSYGARRSVRAPRVLRVELRRVRRLTGGETHRRHLDLDRLGWVGTGRGSREARVRMAMAAVWPACTASGAGSAPPVAATPLVAVVGCARPLVAQGAHRTDGSLVRVLGCVSEGPRPTLPFVGVRRTQHPGDGWNRASAVRCPRRYAMCMVVRPRRDAQRLGAVLCLTSYNHGPKSES